MVYSAIKLSEPNSAYYSSEISSIVYSMKIKLALFVCFVIVLTASLTPFLARAADVSGSLANYDTPHDICEYYRSIAMNIVRETDYECLVSIGEGEYKVFTQVYYSGSEWCAKVINNNQTYQSKCIPRATNTDWNSIYFIIGFMAVLFIVIGAINSIGKQRPPIKSSTADTNSQINTESNKAQSLDRSDVGSIKASAESTADELEKLSKLKEKGTITQKEFEMAKKKLLK